MNSYKSLVSVFMKSVKMDKATEKSRKIKVLFLSIFAVVCVMIPITVGCGVFVNLMTQTLTASGNYSFGILLMFIFISIFTIIFGINVIFNELYFSNDIEYLLPLPLRPGVITAAKFTAAFNNENFMQFMLVFACIVGFGTAYKMSVLQWIIAFVGGFILPVVPMAYCAIIGILMMSFTRIIKSKDTIRKISMIIMLLIFAVFAYSLSSLKNIDIENYVISAANSDIQFISIMKVVFPQIGMLVKAMSGEGVIYFAEYILVNILVISVFLLVSELFYIRSVTGLSQDSGKKKKTSLKWQNNCKVRSAGYSYFLKELKMLIRTPIFFTNCVAITFLWPVFVFIGAKIKGINMTSASLIERYGQIDNKFAAIALVFMIAISIVMTAMNSLGSNAFSREGKHFEFIKYIPVSYKSQWNIKAAVSIVISSLGIVIYAVIFGIYIRAPFLHIILWVVLSVLACTFVTYLGMLLDSMRPKLVWDDELSALRENDNTFFNMAISMVAAAILGVSGYLLIIKTSLGITKTGLILILILGLLCILLYKKSMKKGLQNIVFVEA